MSDNRLILTNMILGGILGFLIGASFAIYDKLDTIISLLEKLT